MSSNDFFCGSSYESVSSGCDQRREDLVLNLLVKKKKKKTFKKFILF